MERILPKRGHASLSLMCFFFMSLGAGLELTGGWDSFEAVGGKLAMTSRQQLPAVGSGNLKLDLRITPTSVRPGEPIPFQLILTNTGKTAVTLLDETPENRAFGIRVSGAHGFAVGGDAMSPLYREGKHVEPPRRPSQKTLAAGERMEAAGDLLKWVGPLEPGNYTVTGSYLDSPPLKAESPKVALSVIQ